MVYMQPRANMSPVGRQPFRPGQWQGFKGVSKNTTYVQNNFFGGAYGNYYDSAMNYDCGGNCGPSKLEKWMMGLGVGTTLLGGILSLFKKDKNTEQGGQVTPQPDNKQQDEIDKLKKRIAELEEAKKQPAPEVKPQVTPEVKPQQAPQVTPKEDTKPDPYKDFGKNGIICRDEGGTRNITGSAGQINITKAGAAGQPPQEFTLTDTTENNKGNTYTYKLTGQTSDGKPIYSCTSKNGQPVSKGNQYIYDNGELVQKNGMEGTGSGLRTDAEVSAAATPSPVAAPSATHTPSSVQSNSAKQDPVDKVRNTVSTNRALSPERKTEITDLAESVQNSKLDDKTKADLINKLDQMSHGITFANDGVFAKTKSDIETQIKKAETNANLPEDAKNWNKSHPDQQVSVSTVNGKTTYSTTAKIQTKFGVKEHKISGSSIQDLGKQIAELKKKAAESDKAPINASVNGYANLGRAMQHSNNA